MASPIAHSIIGLAMGAAAILPRSESPRALSRHAARAWKPLLACVLIACAPDIDYIPGLFQCDFNMFHQRHTHSMLWVAIFAFMAWLVARARNPDAGPRAMAFLFALAFSHLAIDLLTDDASVPRGIMIAWPFSDRYLFLPFHVFPRMAKREWTEILNTRNFAVAGFEVAATLPFLAAAILWKIRPGVAVPQGMPVTADERNP